MKYTLLIASCAVVAGCATTEKFENMLSSWVGANESALIGSWGPPQSSYSLPDGSKVLQYQRSGQVFIPGYATATTTYAGNQAFTNINGMPSMAITQQCMVNWTINPDGRVARWSWQGNACKAT
jgi:hypothetical protein